MMAQGGVRRWWDLTSAEFRDLPVDRCVAILPVGAVEQHGPHLPVGVDSLLCQAVLDGLLAVGANSPQALILPMLPVGNSNEHQAFPGTLSLSIETLIRTWTEIGESVSRAGLRKLLLLNSHGGQIQALDIVARELRVSQRMFVVTATLGAFGPARTLFPDDELRHGIHGGGIETSMMLHLHPGLVRGDRRSSFESAGASIERDYRFIRPEGAAVGFGWQIQDLHPSGACGNALDADADRGRQMIDGTVADVIALIQEIARFPLDFIRD
jgi:creatinine amidohydrolase